jgi:hypothetical protein
MDEPNTEMPLEVGQQIEIDGRKYWIASIKGQDQLSLMPDPDHPQRPRLTSRAAKKKDGIWPIFWVIILIVALIRMVFL